jgi:ribonuclease HII
MDIYEYDQSLRKKGHLRLAGIDEAGRGPLAGPVVAAAVVMGNGVTIAGLRDSKKVPEDERESLYVSIRALAVDIGVGIVEPDDIDRMNILRATRKAMEKAIANLSMTPDMLIIDALSLPSVHIRQHSPTKAESISASVAAASIIAKCTRDKIMCEYHQQYPQYNFSKHKGYATREHIEALQRCGPCPIHRKSFFRVMSLELPF